MRSHYSVLSRTMTYYYSVLGTNLLDFNLNFTFNK